jgi:eukaryotic-like serine/threonine-protein kinase
MGVGLKPATIQFGQFELDLRSGELSKLGRKIRLQQQSFQILAVLLDRPRQVVTREELRQTLWPGDIHVDFDHGLNNAIKRLREALGDLADKPHYIETLPRKGYRFIAELRSQDPELSVSGPARLFRFAEFECDTASGRILRKGEPLLLETKALRLLFYFLENRNRLISKQELLDRVWPEFNLTEGALPRAIGLLRKALDDDGAQPRIIETVPSQGYQFVAAVQIVDSVAASLVAASLQPAIPREPERSTKAQTSRSSRFRAWFLAVSVLLLATGALLFRFSKARPLTEQDTIIVGDFANNTGDPVFDETLRQGLAVQLEQSPFLSLVPELRIQQLLLLMGQPQNTRLMPDVTREICERNASTAFLDGSISQLGSQYVMGLRATDCRSGKLLAEEQVQVARKEDVLGALSAIASKLRTRLGESLSTTEKYDTPLADATTPSLEALKAFSLGVKRYYSEEQSAGLPFFQRAVELDPNFAIAYAFMSCSCSVQPDLAASNIRKAYALREKVSDQERFFIDATYYEFGTGDLAKAITVEELWARVYPREFEPYLSLGYDYRHIGDSEASLGWARKAVPLEPSDALAYESLAADYMNLNQLSEAEEVFKEIEERKIVDPRFKERRYHLAFLQGDKSKMAQLESSAMMDPENEDTMLASQADTAAWYGKLRAARELDLRASSFALHKQSTETAAKYRAISALFEVAAGNLDQGRADLDAASKLTPNRDVKEIAPLVMAATGNPAAAEKMSTDLDGAYPTDTQIQGYWLPAIRASIALQRNDPVHAVEALQTTNALELAFPEMLTAYLRGEAFLKLHDGKRAALEYGKFTDHWGLVRNSPYGALARLGLARAYLLQGDMVRARSAYEAFLTLWKDADADNPVLKQARMEYAGLH